MNLISSCRVRFEPLRSLGFAGISTNYALIGTPLDNPARIIKIDNVTNDDIVISFDGVTDHIYIVSLGFILLDFSSNKANQVGFLELPAGSKIYAKCVDAVSSGAVHVSVVYAAQV